eukprot:scaffold8995_cov120-Isochrysis_galbana.AAC.10
MLGHMASSTACAARLGVPSTVVRPCEAGGHTCAEDESKQAESRARKPTASYGCQWAASAAPPL